MRLQHFSALQLVFELHQQLLSCVYCLSKLLVHSREPQGEARYINQHVTFLVWSCCDITSHPLLCGSVATDTEQNLLMLLQRPSTTQLHPITELRVITPQDRRPHKSLVIVVFLQTFNSARVTLAAQEPTSKVSCTSAGI